MGRKLTVAARIALALASAIVVVLIVWFRLPVQVFYQGGRPTRVGTLVNGAWARYSAFGLPPHWWVTVETLGRRSGRIIPATLVVGAHGSDTYLVSMLGERSAWVQNARAAGGRAVIRHGRRRPVVLEEVPPEERAPIIKAYLDRAPGARPHIPVPPAAPVADFEPIVAEYPVFRIRDVNDRVSSIDAWLRGA